MVTSRLVALCFPRRERRSRNSIHDGSPKLEHGAVFKAQSAQTALNSAAGPSERAADEQGSYLYNDRDGAPYTSPAHEAGHGNTLTKQEPSPSCGPDSLNVLFAASPSGIPAALGGQLQPTCSGSSANIAQAPSPQRSMADHKLRFCCPSPVAHTAVHPASGPCAPLALPLDSNPAPASHHVAVAQGRRATAPPEKVPVPNRAVDPWDASSAGLLGLSDPGGMAEVTLTLDETSRKQLLQQQQQRQEAAAKLRPIVPVPASPRPHLPPLPAHAAPQAATPPAPALPPPHAMLPPSLPPLQPPPRRQLPQLAPQPTPPQGLHDERHDPNHDEDDEPDCVIYDPELDEQVASRTAAWVAATAASPPEDDAPFAVAADDLPWNGAATMRLHTAATTATAAQGPRSYYTGSVATSSRPSTGYGASRLPYPHLQPPGSPYPYVYPPDPHYRGQLPASIWRRTDCGGGAAGIPATRVCGNRASCTGERGVGVPEDPAAARYLERGMLLSAALKINKGQQAAAKRVSLASGGAPRQQLLQKQQSGRKAQSVQRPQSRSGSHYN